MEDNKLGEELRKKGITELEYEQQVLRLRTGTHYVRLMRPATVGDGILKINETQRKQSISRYDKADVRALKFIPASGAATRLFKRVYDWIQHPDFYQKEINEFFLRVEDFAFFDEWVKAADREDVETYVAGLDSKVRWLRLMIEPSGLNLAALPKSLIPFHRYARPETPLREHFIEAQSYAQSKLHFTVSPEHLPAVKEEVNRLLATKEFVSESFKITYSIQEESTDTIALDDHDQPVRVNGKLLFRPGGHGALIHNLNALDSDLVFLKNIDNVCHQRLIQHTIEAKKMLGGLLLQLRDDLRVIRSEITKGVVDHTTIEKVRKKWSLRIPYDYPLVKEYIDRPIRVCGMVRNEGEPGGGPFWTQDFETGESLQIIEQQQVNSGDASQQALLKSSTHFNPVDLVCCLRDLEGRKIDLLKHVDHNQYFIANKAHHGQQIRALEWPGLWNGAMARWITVFVEVPSTTFNPVKEIHDLLRINHLPEVS